MRHIEGIKRDGRARRRLWGMSNKKEAEEEKN
jgi:hypothetical protein